VQQHGPICERCGTTIARTVGGRQVDCMVCLLRAGLDDHRVRVEDEEDAAEIEDDNGRDLLRR